MRQATLSRVLDDIRMLRPDELQKVAHAIHARLSGKNDVSAPGAATQEQIDAAEALLRKTIVTLPYATGAENESIDADLVREYGDDHAGLYGSTGEK